jgi:hypothetical protein
VLVPSEFTSLTSENVKKEKYAFTFFLPEQLQLPPQCLWPTPPCPWKPSRPRRLPSSSQNGAPPHPLCSPFNAETIKAIEAPHHHQSFLRLPRPLPSTPAPINASPRTLGELRTSQAPHQLSSPGLPHQNTPPPSAPTTTAPPCCPAASLPLTL